MNPVDTNSHWLLRVALASVLIFHGVLKLLNLSGFAAMLPISYVETLLVALAETAGGVLIVVGGLGSTPIYDLATRLGALMNVPVLIGAITIVHWGRWNFLPTESHPAGGFEFQAVLLLLSIYLVVTGNDRRAARPAPFGAIPVGKDFF